MNPKEPYEICREKKIDADERTIRLALETEARKDLTLSMKLR